MSLVFPSYFKAGEAPNFYEYIYNNMTLKMGQVIKANYPDPAKDKNAFITYNVMVNEQKDFESYNIVYYDCLPMQLFGSATDYFEYSLRANTQEGEGENQDDLLTTGTAIQLGQSEEVKKILGSVVVIACLGGDSGSPVIIGSLPNFFLDKNENYEPQKKEDGKFLKFNFNGVYVNINNLGELFIQRQGATTSQGGLTGVDASERNVNEEKANSFIKINQDGEIILSVTSKKQAKDLSKEKLEHSVIIDKDGNINIRIDDGQTLEIKNNDTNTLMTLGAGEQSAAIAEKMEALYNRLSSYIENAIVATGFGPSGTIQAASGDGPPWDPDIESKCLKLPK